MGVGVEQIASLWWVTKRVCIGNVLCIFWEVGEKVAILLNQ